MIRHHYSPKNFLIAVAAYVFRQIALNPRRLSAGALGIAFIAFASVLINACNDRPTPVGSEFSTGILQVTTLSSDSVRLLAGTSTGIVRKPLSYAGWFVGRTDNMEAKTFLNFDIPFIPFDYLYAGATPNDVTAILSLPIASFVNRNNADPTRRPFIFGDTVRSNLDFRIVELLQSWTDSATVDTLETLELTGLIYGKTIGRFAGKSIINETVITDSTIISGSASLSPEYLKIPIDSRTVMSWMRRDTSLQKLNGLALLPNRRSAAIRGGVSNATDYAYIDVTIRRPSDTVDATYRFYQNHMVSFVTNPPSVAPSAIVAQGGVLRRSAFSLDLSKIPPLSFIHYAELTLTWDSVNSRLSNRGMPSTLYLKRRSSNFTVADTSIAGLLPYVEGQRIEGTMQYVFKGVSSSSSSSRVNISLAEMIDYLLNSPLQPDKTLILQVTRDLEAPPTITSTDARDYQEFIDMSSIVFCGLQDPDPAKRPVLRITYSQRKK